MAQKKNNTPPVTPPTDETENTPPVTPPEANTTENPNLTNADNTKKKSETKTPKFLDFSCPYASVRIGEAYFDATDGVVTIPSELAEEAERMGLQEK